MTEVDMVQISYHPQFLKDLKRLNKKYKSLKHDYENLLSELSVNPNLGVDLGHGVRKVRMAIASKGKGKSAGARVITYKRIQITTEAIHLILLSAYDKSEVANVSDQYIRSLIDSVSESI